MVAIMHILLCGVLKHEYCRARTDGVVLGHNHAIGAQLAKQGLGTSGSGALFRWYAYRIQNRVVDIDVADSRRLDPSLFYIWRSEEHTSELQSLMRISYAVFCLKKKTSNPIMNTLIYINA